jgi:pimeloyl-ACP methyl ester carboxylesterase
MALPTTEAREVGAGDANGWLGTGAAAQRFVRNGVTKARSLRSWWSSLWPSFREAHVLGVRARYLCNGSGPPLLVLTSPLAFGRTYMRAMRSLCRSFTVVCVELPGSGGSEKLAEPWSVEQYAEWTLELVRYLPLAAPVVIGHGASAAVAVELARLAPQEIGGVVLADAPGASPAFGVRALPEIILNAVRHRSTFAEHVKAARGATARAALESTARPLVVPTLHASRLADDWKSIRRFVVAVRRSADAMRAGTSARAAFAS